MADIFHYWRQDIRTSASGDLLAVTGSELGRQRILRRLLTNPGAYIFHPDYGAGLPAYIGKTLDARAIEGVIRSQIMLEGAVAPTPIPAITVRPLNDGIFVDIAYTDANTGEPIRLSFDVNK